MRWVVILLGAIIGGGLLVGLALDDPELVTTEANVISSDLEVPAIGFAQVADAYEWQFPQDYGPHPVFQREQWEIQSDEGCEIPFAVLFDRASFVADTFAPERESAWAMNGILQATLTIDDNPNGRNINVTRSSRVAVGLAGADENRVWVEDWAWNWTDGMLLVVGDDARLELSLTSENQAVPVTEIGWNTYERLYEARGEAKLPDRVIGIKCATRLTHRFGS